MGISINTNIAATRASHFQASNHANLQKSLDHLSSGRRIPQPADDTGGLAAPFGNKLTLVDVNFTAESFTNAVANVAKLRAANGGQVSRLQYAKADVDSKMTNMGAAFGRILDVDIAAESSNLAKQQILVQASAAMTAQANSANDVALLLLQ